MPLQHRGDNHRVVTIKSIKHGGPRFPGSWFVSYCCLLVALVIGAHWVAIGGEEFENTNLPNTTFSAQRAVNVVKELEACGNRESGTYAAEVCAPKAILKEVESIGFSEEDIQIDNFHSNGSFYMSFLGGVIGNYRNITNIAFRLNSKKEKRTKGRRCAVLAAAHYDSALGVPGISDNAMQVGLLTELMRVFKARNLMSDSEIDLIVNFNGAEETLMHAAHGFAKSSKWARDVCAIVNLECNGGHGRELLFQVGSHALVSQYKRAAKRPAGSSFIHSVFQAGVVPGDTDYRVLRDFILEKQGLLVPGVDFATIGNQYVYHTIQSMQRYGETIVDLLALMTNEGVEKPVDAEPPGVYFDLLGKWFVVYSTRVAYALHIISALIVLMLSLSNLTLSPRPWLIGAFFFAELCGALGYGSIAMFIIPRGYRLAYQNHTWLTVPLFLFPAVAGYLFAKRRIAGKSDESSPGDIFWTCRLVAAILCLGHTVLVPTSSYLSFLWCTFPLIYVYTGRYFMSFVAGYTIPIVVTLQLMPAAFDLLVPLCARSGALIPPEVIVGLFVFSPVILCISAMGDIPFALARRIGGTLGLERALLAGFGAAVVGTVLFGGDYLFPYSPDRPKRMFTFHVNHVDSKESFLYMSPYDVNRFEPIPGEIFRTSKGLWDVKDTEAIYGNGAPYYFPLQSVIKEMRRVKVEHHGNWSDFEVYTEKPIELDTGVVRTTIVAKAKNAQYMTMAVPHDGLVGFPALRGRLPPVRTDCNCHWLNFDQGGEHDSVEWRAEIDWDPQEFASGVQPRVEVSAFWLENIPTAVHDLVEPLPDYVDRLKFQGSHTHVKLRLDAH
ncbi:Endoplasmic reticulum metallopeptidase 1 [Perkinsus chesapeaki]|uniref:Endoplasmic reticulum metallopeptidase 1 n=1 Tax=Perkinsus chesapeaki TaxID=330153 RepID=A0A7J6N2U2_PERCH|nr:Endoplasmic reticulum metallopeptidase 1 [Perkinsus chesapeaki]